jgi:hypothetical protein
MADRKQVKGIFCLEGDWDLDLRSRATVEPVLQLLERSNDPPIPHIRRDVGTTDEFEYYLRIWTQRKYSKYPILYLGFHGKPDLIYVGRGRASTVSLDWLAQRLSGKCKGRVIHFGTCGTLDTHGQRLNSFLRQTGAIAVCGYREDIDWMHSAAFEIILLGAFQKNAITRAGMRAIQKRVKREASGLARDLAFRMVVAQ